MLNILIVGPTGYVGESATEQLFLAGNHEIFGLASNQSAGYRLAAKEIIPIVGKVSDADSVTDAVRQGNIDIIVDTTSFNDKTAKPTIFSAVYAAGQQLLASQSTKTSPPKKVGFITVTGIWTHGSNEDPGCSFKLGKEGSIMTTPPEGLQKAREDYEDSVLAAREVLDVGIIRPPFIFGRGGSAWTRALLPLVQALDAQPQPEQIRVPVTPHTMVNFVNIIDVGTAVEKLVNRLHSISGTSVVPLFELVSDRFDFQDICVADSKLFGCTGTIMQNKSTDATGRDGGDVFLERIGRTDNMDSSKARLELGWVPQRPGFVRRTNIYAHSFLAIRALAKEEREKGGRLA